MTYVEKRGIFFFRGGGCLQIGKGELGWKRRRRNSGGEGWQTGDIFTFVDGLIMPVILSAIMMVNWSRHCMEIRV